MLGNNLPGRRWHRYSAYPGVLGTCRESGINDAERQLLEETRDLLVEKSFGIYTHSSPNIPYLAIAALIKSGQIQHADIAKIPIIPPGIQNAST